MSQMSPAPCLCKVDCGLQQGPSPFLLLAAAATLVAFLIALVGPKQSSVHPATERTERREIIVSTFDHRRPNGSGPGSEDGSNTDSDDGSDSDGSEDSQPYTSSVTIRADVESRLAAFQKEQEASLQEFRSNTTAEATRQRRILSDRSAESQAG